MNNEKTSLTAAEITEIRHKTGLSQRQFSDKYGFSFRTMQEWEQGRRRPGRYAVDKLMAVSD